MTMSQRSRTISWKNPAAMLDAAKNVSGLEVVKAVFAGKLPDFS